jgi:putative ABC transport system permease protein
MPVSTVLIAIVISLLVGLVSGFLPAYRASRLDPVDALRYE